MQRALKRFQESVTTDLDELQSAIELEDCDQIASVAHRIKGACANIAAPRMKDQAAIIEECAKNGEIRGISGSLQRIQDESQHFQDYLEELELIKT